MFVFRSQRYQSHRRLKEMIVNCFTLFHVTRNVLCVPTLYYWFYLFAKHSFHSGSFVLFTLGNRIFYFERIQSDDRMPSISPASVDVFSYQWVSYPLRHLICWISSIWIRHSFCVQKRQYTSGLILVLRPANKRWCYCVTTSPIGWAQA